MLIAIRQTSQNKESRIRHNDYAARSISYGVITTESTGK
jgi:hypothetical protein